MTLRNFVSKNREELREVVKSLCPNCSLALTELEDWVLNDEGLYMWARGCGVNI